MRGFRSFVGEMKKDFPTLNEFAEQAELQKQRKQGNQSTQKRFGSLRPVGGAAAYSFDPSGPSQSFAAGPGGLTTSLSPQMKRGTAGSPAKRRIKNYQGLSSAANGDDIAEMENAQRAKLLSEAQAEHEEKYRLLKEKNEKTK